MDFIILTAVLSCLNSSFYVASRVLFVLASRGDAPRWLVKTNARHVPARSVLLGSLAGLAGIAARELAPDTVFAFLVNASGAVIVFVYMAICVSQVRLRRARDRAGVATVGLRMWLFPFGSYVAIAAMAAVLVAMALTPEMHRDLGFSLLSLAVALAAYALFRRGRAAT
jgi:L-asparagine transporter-like permease